MGKKSELDDLRARLETLEAEVSRLRGAAAATGTAVGTTPGPAAAVRVEDQPGQPQSMTRIADALGVMVSGRAEARAQAEAQPEKQPEKQPERRAEEGTEARTQVLRTRPEPSERRSVPLPERSGGQFLESLLSGRPALQK
ncbi:hypothetical protein ACIRVF_24675 [Kitasatospora sp. NPDC101157]|uniref:hypothetical protein n=1 Tax=Kitasatospora sp. NPDC101157 TaxID=3364098 RepID=UPI0038233E37